MPLNNISKIIYSKLLKIWSLHLLIFYPICSFLEDNLEVHSFCLKSTIDPEFWKVALWAPFNALSGFWEKFLFFIFMAFGISVILNLFLKNKFIFSYVMSLLVSYLIVYLVHRYTGDIFYYIIPSLVITVIIQIVIFRKSIFDNKKLQKNH